MRPNTAGTWAVMSTWLLLAAMSQATAQTPSRYAAPPMPPGRVMYPAGMMYAVPGSYGVAPAYRVPAAYGAGPMYAVPVMYQGQPAVPNELPQIADAAPTGEVGGPPVVPADDGSAVCGECGDSGECGRCGLLGRLGWLRGIGGGGGLRDPGGCGLLKQIWNGPLAANGLCTPRWFDVHAEFMYLTRENVSRRINFTSDGLGVNNVVLSTDSLEFYEEPGFRVTAAYLVGPGTNIEASYFGTSQWDASAQAVATGTLFSPFSNFNLPGFPPADLMSFHSIDYQSRLHSAEVDLRHRWVSLGGRFHGSWLAGARYLRLDEEFRFLTASENPPANFDLDYAIDTKNDLIGFQLGGDLWASITPRVMLGGELKAGIYGNAAEQRTTIATSNQGDPGANEFETDSEAAFVGEAGVMTVVHVSPRCTFRGGYQFLYVNGVALAPENFNASVNSLNPPYFEGRTARINSSGAVFYHGFTAGLEWLW